MTTYMQKIVLVFSLLCFSVMAARNAGPAAPMPDKPRGQPAVAVAVHVAEEKPPSPPPAVARPVESAGDKSATAGRQGAAMKVEGILQDPGTLLPWMLSRGWLAVLADKDNKLVGRILADRRVIAPSVVTGGVVRDATAELAGFIGGLPSGAARGWLIWTAATWRQIEKKLRAHGDVHTVRLRYDLTRAGLLAVTIVEVRTTHAVERPGETFTIQL